MCDSRPGFTLVELLVVLVVLAVLAAIVLPKFMNSSQRSKEAALKNDLRLVREAVDRFYNDTGLYPATLDDLAATSAPPKGLRPNGTLASIDASDWQGPYLESVPNDPVAREPFAYKTGGAGVGRATSSATGITASDGTPFEGW